MKIVHFSVRKFLKFVSISISLIGLQSNLASLAETSHTKNSKAPTKNIAGRKVSTTILSQDGRDFGHLDVYLNSEAVRLNFIKLDCSILARGPNFDVFVFNTRDHTLYQQSYLSWLKSGGPNIVSDYMSSEFGKNAPLTRGVYNGWPADIRTKLLKNPRPDKVSEMLYQQREARKKIIEPWNLTMVSGNDIKLNPKILRILEETYQFPKTNGPPLATIFTNLRGNRYVTFNTKDRKQQLVDDSIFTVPAGLKKVATVEMAITGAGLSAVIDELMTDK